MIPRINLCAMLIAAELLLGRTAYGYEGGIYTDDAPPPPRTERMPRPHDGLVWAPGHWEWSGKAFYWIEGSWLVERRKRHWVPAQWEQAGNKWHFLPGHWDNRA
jgi:WXXGXW repeat (2 copies)